MAGTGLVVVDFPDVGMTNTPVLIPLEIATPVLAILLYLPVSKMVWVLSVRRLERKLARPLDEEQRRAQLRRARFIAVIVSIVFSLLFNLHLARTVEKAAGG